MRYHTAAFVMSAALTIPIASSLAVDLYPGQSVSVPTSFFGSATTIDSGSVQFTQSNGGFPPSFLTGTVDYSVRRRSDNTLEFRYQLSAEGFLTNGAFYGITNHGFAGFNTDVAANSLIIIGTNPPVPSSAIRSSNGDDVEFQFYSNLITPGVTSRQIRIVTDATNYDYSGRMTGEVWGTTETIVGLPAPAPADTTPPVATINAPTSFACVCNPAQIVGSVADAEGVDSWTLEWSQTAGGPWNTIATGQGEVSNATLASWDTTNVPHGHNFVRLTATNFSNMTDFYTTVVYVDQAFTGLELRRPIASQTLGGFVCFDGTAWDHCFSRYSVEYEAPDGSSGPVDPNNSTYTTAVINDPLASWDTTARGFEDGTYTVTLTGVDQCGHTETAQAEIVIDNTPPIATLDLESCDRVDGVLQIRGTAFDTNIDRWHLQYIGGDADQWTTIASGTSSVIDGLLANWDTTNLRPCAYALRLLAVDQSAIDCGPYRQEAYDAKVVNVGCDADYDQDGDGTITDLLAFLNAYFAGCPSN